MPISTLNDKILVGYTMSNFFLVRHGNKPNIAGDPRLSNLGIQQTQITALYLKDKSITQIYSSPFKRTQETAQVIAAKLTIEKVQIDDRLKERFNWGNDPSQTFDQFMEEWKKTTINRDYTPPKGDSSQDAGKRLKDIVDKLKDNNNENILLVTHGGVIVDLLRNLFDDEYLKSFSPNFLNAGIGECSITQLTAQNGKYVLKEFDSVTHLPQSLQLRSSSW